MLFLSLTMLYATGSQLTPNNLKSLHLDLAAISYSRISNTPTISKTNFFEQVLKTMGITNAQSAEIKPTLSYLQLLPRDIRLLTIQVAIVPHINSNPWTLSYLNQLVMNNRYKRLQRLLELGVWQGNSGNTPLIKAVTHGKIDYVALLLSYAGSNGCNHNQILTIAIYNFDDTCVKLLLPETSNELKKKALRYAQDMAESDISIFNIFNWFERLKIHKIIKDIETSLVNGN
jgi:ankyrin repeat protein